MHSGTNAGEVFNIGAGEEHSVLEIADIVLKTLGKSDDLLEYVEDRPGHVVRHEVNSGKIREVVGWGPEEDFGEGLRETVKWYVDNEKWWRKLLDRQVDFAKAYKSNKAVVKRKKKR